MPLSTRAACIRCWKSTPAIRWDSWRWPSSATSNRRRRSFGVQKRMSASRKQKYIRASEASEYVFCARAWWLRREGYEPTRGQQALEAGTEWHLKHGRFVGRAALLRRLSLICALLALLIGVLILLLGWLR